MGEHKKMNDKTRILYIDDYELDRELVRDALEKEHSGFEVTEASNKQEFEALLKNREFDVVLSDFNIAGFEGFQVLEIVRAYDPRLPVIIVTGTGSEEIAVMALKQGASDYVIKRPQHIRRLPQTILVAIEKQTLKDQRHKAEISLKESETRYRSLFENMLNGYAYCRMLFDRNKPEDFIFMAVNTAFKTLTGTKNVVGKKVSEVFPGIKETDPELFEIYGRVARTGIPETFEMYVKALSMWFSVSVYSHENEHFVIVFDNIHKRKQAEEMLRESEKKYRNIFKNAVEGFFQSSPEGRFISVNPAFAEMLGYASPEELISNISDIAKQYYVNPEDRRRYQQILQKTGIVENFEFKAKRKDGSQIWVSNSTRAYFDKDGKVDRYEGIVFDITERIQAEEQRRKLEDQLRQSQKMEAIGTLAGGIAHDFNNILGIIIGNTELAIMDVPEWNPAKECLKEIRTASMRAKDVVRHILSFARKTPAQRKPIQISTIIRDSLKLMRASIPTTIEIRQDIACTTEMIIADPTEINQILMNLCTNSVHALSEETGVLEVNLENEKLKMKNEELGLEAGRYVKLTVKDSGEGIEPEIIDRVFDPYFTTKDVGKGTGMGLAVAYGIVKKHDGAIQVKSELGKGTLVEVLFPLIEKVVGPEVKEDPESLPTGTGRVLFVDDEASLTKMVQQMLERLGYEVVTKTNPKEALELFKSNPDRFDLVITDMAMPQMAGDRLAQELMQIRQDIPVILCTGHSARIDKDSAKALGIRAYTMKPLVMRDLAKTVRKVLDNKESSVPGIS